MKDIYPKQKDIEAKGIKAFHEIYTSELTKEGINIIKIINEMASVALEVEILFPEGLRLLETGSRGTVTLTSRQTVCLLAQMFFCTCVRQKDREMNDNNFAYWIAMGELHAKLRFIFKYFEVALKEEKIRSFSIFRVGLPKVPSTTEEAVALLGFDAKSSIKM